jgi:hypothetical protein
MFKYPNNFILEYLINFIILSSTLKALAIGLKIGTKLRNEISRTGK